MESKENLAFSLSIISLFCWQEVQLNKCQGNQAMSSIKTVLKFLFSLCLFFYASLQAQTSCDARVIAIAAGGGGGEHSLALTSEGTVWAWGRNDSGQLGNGTTTNSSVPVQVSNLTDVIAIAAGESHSLALTADGEVWAWGNNKSGELGNGTTTNSSVPVQVSNLTDVIAIAAGSQFSFAITSDGTAWAWGNDFVGQLGDGAGGFGVISTVPVQVQVISDVIAIAGGGEHALAIQGDGTIWAWGSNSNGQLGNGSFGGISTVPVQVSTSTGLVTAKAIAAGEAHSLAIASDGQIWSWGLNSAGQLGNGTTTDSNVPVTVSSSTGLTEAKSVSAGEGHSLALANDGQVWAWGNNVNGQLGNGTTTNSNVPVTVSSSTGLTEAKSIAAGGQHSLALTADGEVWAWGSNSSGQLGDGTTTNSSVPVMTLLIPTATATPASQTICSGGTTSIALTSNLPDTTFTWTVVQNNVTGASNDSGSSIAQTLTATSTSPGTAVYTITPKTIECGTPISVTVTVNPTPIASATPASQAICSGETTNIALSSNVAGTTFSWTVVQTNVTGASGGSGSSIIQTLRATSATAGTAIYTITPTANGCAGTPISVTVTVNPTPVAIATPASQTICSGGTTSIALTSNVAGTTFSWTVVQTNVKGATAGSGSSIVQTLRATSATAGTAVYTITPTANGCAGTPISVTVTVNPTPVAIATPASQTICSGGTTSIALTSNVAGTTFSWAVAQINVKGASAGSGSSIAQTLTATSTLPGIAVYTITPTANGCTGSPITVAILVNPIPIAIATPASQTICSGETTSIFLTSNISGATFTWTVAQTNVTGASAGSGNLIAQTLTATSTEPGVAIYIITPTVNDCRGAPIIVTINVRTDCGPVAPLAPTDFRGHVRKDKFATQTDVVHVLSWNPSPDSTVVGYRIYLGNKVIETIPADGPFKVSLHNRSPRKRYTYTLVAFNAANVESNPLTMTLP
jgi:alpha-tubulin suppressor-like RCC1 family protein